MLASQQGTLGTVLSASLDRQGILYRHFVWLIIRLCLSLPPEIGTEVSGVASPVSQG